MPHHDPYGYVPSLHQGLDEDDEPLEPLLFDLLNGDHVTYSDDHSTNFWTIFLNDNITDSL
jgi:hypothetical protein